MTESPRRRSAVALTVWRKTFRLWERLGFHITPNHYLFPIPDTRELKDELWERESELVGINLDEEAQLQLLSVLASRYRREYEVFSSHADATPDTYVAENPFFGAVDGEILYSFVRHFKPRRIYEIGSGFSTLVFAKAILKNRKEVPPSECELNVIDPFASEAVHRGFPALGRLTVRPVQEIPVSEFSKLSANDVLFIDSSHVLKIGGDVQYEYLEILPRLNKGVLVHVHDIFLPAEYPKKWIDDYWFWNEQYLLQAFLTFNDKFRVLWSSSFMHMRHPDLLQAAFPSYDPHRNWPGSFWLQRSA